MKDVKFKPLDTRTDKQKLIDEACDKCLELGIDARNSDKSVIEKMISSGYRWVKVNDG